MSMPQTERHKPRVAIVALIGYLLSPLSWWNDAYINIPIAYVLSLPFLLIGKQAFLLSIVAIYWLSNITGLILLHGSARALLTRKERTSRRRQIIIDLLVSVAYTLIVASLAYFDILPMPELPGRG